MGFSEQDIAAMRSLKGVGNTVVSRLAQIGFSSLSQLAEADPAEITQSIAQLMGSTCWQNSPQARKAIQAIIDLAKQRRSLD